jgi:hypothetical protein
VRLTAKFLALMFALAGARELAAQPASERPLPSPPPPSDEVAGTEFEPGIRVRDSH